MKGKRGADCCLQCLKVLSIILAITDLGVILLAGLPYLLLLEGLLVKHVACHVEPCQVSRVLHCQVGSRCIACLHFLLVPLHPSVHTVASLLWVEQTVYTSGNLIWENEQSYQWEEGPNVTD